MTISTTASRISYNGNGTTVAFSFPYRFLTNADLTVIRVAANGTETTLALGTDYTVTGADDDAGGTVTCVTAPVSGARLVIYRSVAITQEVDYITGDSFPAETHERALDRLTMVAQQLQDAVDRSAKLSETSTADADTLVTNINSLAAIEDDVSAVAAIDTDVSAVAAIDSAVTTVAGIAANVTTVAGVAANVTTVAGVAANVTTVAGISSAVSTVAADGTDIGVVAGISADVQAVADIAADVAAVENIAANVTTVAGISSNVTTVAGISANVTTVAGISAAVSTVATNIADVQNAEENADAAIAAKDAALVAQAAAEAALASFNATYLGAQSSDPSVDNEGDAVTAGDWYFNTTSNISRIYSGSAWGNVSLDAGIVVGKTGSTGSAVVPAGTQAQRDGSPSAGYFRFNSDTSSFEGYNGTLWGSVGGGATGGGADAIFIENDQAVTANYTIPATKNAMSTGPVSVNSGVTVTVSSGARWVVI